MVDFAHEEQTHTRKMSLTGHVDSMAWISLSLLGGKRSLLINQLTVRLRPRRTTALEEVDGELREVTRNEKTPEPIHTYVVKDGFLGMPISYAMSSPILRDVEWEDTTSGGTLPRWIPSRLPDPTHPSAPPHQGEFFNDIREALQTNYTVLATAPTGSGKTVAAYNSIGRAGLAAIVVVPTTVIAEQWAKEATRHLGIPREEIALLSNGQMKGFRGKKLVVAVIHNLVFKEWDERFWRYFGFAVFDEAHNLGAREFSRVMKLIPARYKLALSATPNRADGNDALLRNQFGKPSAVGQAPALATTCYAIKYPLVGNLEWLGRCRNDAKPMKWLSKLEGRNEMLTDLIHSLYDKGRHVIVMSKFIDHLELLRGMLIAKGIPEEEVGQYTRGQGTKRARVGQAYLDKVKAESRVLLSTYAMTKEAFDCPRLDAGVEALPVSNNVQGVGRIRRKLRGKKHPIWFTILDLNVSLFLRYSKKRLTGYEAANVVIKELDRDSF